MKKTTAKISAQQHSFTVIYEPIEEGYQITVPALPGLITFGRDFEEAREMASDAIVCYLEGLRAEREKIPSESSVIQEKLTVSLA